MNAQNNDIELVKYGNKYTLKNINPNTPYQVDDSTRQLIFSRISDKVSKNNLKINTITKEYFEDLINQNPILKNTLNSFSQKIEELNKNKEHGIYLDPIRLINENTGQEEYYNGEFNDKGEFYGIGKHIFDKNYIYIGEFKNNLYNGTGLMINNEGSLFGDWVNGDCTGKANLIIENQLNYEGDFLNNLKNGIGIEKYPDGSYYEGNFKNGEKNGYGKYFFSNGEFYEGNFENDLYNGEGIYEWPSEGRKYKGMFKNGNMEGYGENKYIDGSMFNGKYLNGMKNGEGTYIWNDGKKFVGQWVNNVLHGVGYFYNRNEKFEVVFKLGKVISSTKISE